MLRLRLRSNSFTKSHIFFLVLEQPVPIIQRQNSIQQNEPENTKPPQEVVMSPKPSQKVAIQNILP